MLVALTGGIGSGKSTVAAEWVRLGATEVDADLLAREVVEPGTPGLSQVTEAFGKDILNADGTLDRAALAKKAFSAPDKRLLLESILHPLIQELSKSRTRKLEGFIVYTIPLLAETKSSLEFDRVVTISCPEEVRVKRLVARGLTESEARLRIASQAKDAERESRADVVIDSNCTKDELIDRAREVFRELNG
jgi:dephospho-CoA kinase